MFAYVLMLSKVTISMLTFGAFSSSTPNTQISDSCAWYARCSFCKLRVADCYSEFIRMGNTTTLQNFILLKHLRIPDLQGY